MLVLRVICAGGRYFTADRRIPSPKPIGKSLPPIVVVVREGDAISD
jgi:hypothetical protein